MVLTITVKRQLKWSFYRCVLFSLCIWYWFRTKKHTMSCQSNIWIYHCLFHKVRINHMSQSNWYMPGYKTVQNIKTMKNFIYSKPMDNTRQWTKKMNTTRRCDRVTWKGAYPLPRMRNTLWTHLVNPVYGDDPTTTSNIAQLVSLSRTTDFWNRHTVFVAQIVMTLNEHL